MLLTGDCSPGDSLGLVTMETSNQGKMFAVFPSANGSKEIPEVFQPHTHTHERAH